MSYLIVLLCSLSITVPAVLAAIKIRTASDTFFPFFILLWLGMTNELITAILSKFKISTALNTNCYILFEALLLLWQFFNWKTLSKSSFFLLIGVSFICLWIGEYCLIDPKAYLFWYWISYAFIMILLAQHEMARIVVRGERLFTDPAFWINGCFIIYYVLSILVQCMWNFGMSLSESFRNNVFYIMVGQNIIINIIYTLVILWIPKRPKYITL